MSKLSTKTYFTKDELNTTNVENNMGLVYYIVKGYAKTIDLSNTSDTFEDLVSIGTIGLIKAVNTFDEDKGYKFATYATRCIHNEILMNFRKNKKRNQEISMNTIIHVDKEGNEMTIENTIEGQIDCNQDDGMELQEVLNILPLIENKKKRNVLLLLLAGKTQREIAAIMEVSQSYISRLQQKATKEIRRKIDTSLPVDFEKGPFTIKVQEEILILTIKRRCRSYTFHRDEQGYSQIYDLVKQE